MWTFKRARAGDINPTNIMHLPTIGIAIPLSGEPSHYLTSITLTKFNPTDGMQSHQHSFRIYSISVGLHLDTNLLSLHFVRNLSILKFYVNHLIVHWPQSRSVHVWAFLTGPEPTPRGLLQIDFPTIQFLILSYLRSIRCLALYTIL